MAYRFTRRQRLLTTDDFSSVFSLRRSKANAYFQLWTRPNDLPHGRLGVVVARKVVRTAVGRNRIKRLVRETWRMHGIAGLSLDLIVRAKQPLRRSERAAAAAALRGLLERFVPCPAS